VTSRLTAGGHVRVRPFNTKETYKGQRLDNDLCQAVVAGKTIYLRGQVAQELETSASVALNDPAGQARKVMQNIKQLLEECGAQLENFVRRLLRDDPDTVKVVERCWVDLVKKWQREGTLVQPRALLFKLARQRSTDRIRQINRRPETPTGDHELLDEAATALMDSADFVSALVVRVDVRAALNELPIRQRQALLFTYGYDLEYQDTAALMACSVNTVDNLLRTGKTTMKRSRYLSGYSMAPAPPEVTK